MNPQDEKRLRRLLLWSYFLILLLMLAIVAFFSFRIGETDKTVMSQGNQVEINTGSIEELKQQMEELKEEAKIPGPVGDTGTSGTNGKNGKDSTSTNTIIEKQTTEQTPVQGAPFTFADFTSDQLSSLKGQDARQPILCKLTDGTIGWRFIDNTICLGIE